MNAKRRRLRLAAVAVLLACGAAGPASRAAPPVVFAPHRAIYDVTLAGSGPASGFASLEGRMVYEIRGGACKGYAQSFRYVTVSTDHDGGRQTGDLRSSTWEDANGKRLRFNVEQYQNRELMSVTKGEAARQTAMGPLQVELTKPAKRNVSFPADIYFPMEHSAALIEAARRGRTVFSADFYDGSETGDKLSHATAVIGRESPPGSVAGLTEAEKAGGLNAVASWPVSIAFFEGGAAKSDASPTTEQTYRFYANGVSTGLVSDYGSYKLRFDLKELTFLDADKDCR